MESEKIIIGFIEKELDLIRQRFREKKETSESYIRYYKQIEQPTQIKAINKNEIIPFDNNLYFGGYWNHLKKPFVHWNGFYIQPFKHEGLMNNINEGKIFHNGKIVTDINEIKDYIITYREGFKLGYKYFDEIEIKNKSGIFLSDERSLKRIADYVENNLSDFNHGFTYSFYLNSIGYWKGQNKCKFRLDNKTCSRIKGEQPINICEFCDLQTLPDLKEWKADGFKNGKFYRAWYYILSNTDMFDEYFNKTNNYFPANNEHQPDSKQKPELSINQIALKYAYEGKRITRINGNDIAEQYGHHSGEKLFHRFTFYSSTANRKGIPTLCTLRKLQNKIKLIESIIPLLSETCQDKAKDELKILKGIFEKEYQ